MLVNPDPTGILQIKLTVKSFLQTYFQQKNFFGFEWCNIIWYYNKNSKQKLVRLDLTTLKKLSNLLQNNSIISRLLKIQSHLFKINQRIAKFSSDSSKKN